MTHSGVSLSNFKVLENVVKHFLECVIFFNKLTSVFHVSVLLLIMKFIIVSK